MRIVSGKFKGHPIKPPSTEATRPTTDKARESIFNILAHADWSEGCEGKRVLDVFAGSGALGLEALSRGAEFCLFVETSATARGAIRSNIEALGLFGQTRLHKRDATRMGPKPSGVGTAFDLAFLDPPYGKGLEFACLKTLRDCGWFAPNALIVVEIANSNEQSSWPEGYETLDLRQNKTSSYVFLRFEASEPTQPA